MTIWAVEQVLPRVDEKKKGKCDRNRLIVLIVPYVVAAVSIHM
jgi:hypothetical protein